MTELPSRATDTTIWTSGDSLALASRLPGLEIFSAWASTENFVPQNARAWRVALPGDIIAAGTIRVRPVKGRARF